MLLRLIVSTILLTYPQAVSAVDRFAVVTISGHHIVLVDGGVVVFDGEITVNEKCLDIDGTTAITGVSFNMPNGDEQFYVDGEIVDEVEDWMDYRVIESDSVTPLKINTSTEDNYHFGEDCIQVNDTDVLAAVLLDWDLDAIQSSIAEQVSMEIPLKVPVTTYLVNWRM